MKIYFFGAFQRQREQRGPEPKLPRLLRRSLKGAHAAGDAGRHGLGPADPVRAVRELPRGGAGGQLPLRQHTRKLAEK